MKIAITETGREWLTYHDDDDYDDSKTATFFSMLLSHMKMYVTLDLTDLKQTDKTDIKSSIQKDFKFVDTRIS